MPLNSKQILALLKKDGWYIVAQVGSHVQLKHPTKKGKVTVKHPAKDYPTGTYRSILKQAGLL